ncbi:MAG: hypothetical protein AAF609_12395 [Cyanobacteria bacterium P01_C01_bin.120]
MIQRDQSQWVSGVRTPTIPPSSAISLTGSSLTVSGSSAAKDRRLIYALMAACGLS